MNAGTAQVAVDQQNTYALLRQHHGTVDAGGALALLGQGAGDHDDLGRRAQMGEQERGAQSAIRVRHLRLRPHVGDQLHGFIRRGQNEPFGGRAFACGLRSQRNHTERRQTGDGLGLLGGAHGVVQPFEQKGQPNARRQTEHEGESQIARHVRFDRISRNPGAVHNLEIVGLQSLRNTRFFELLQQAFIKLAVGFEVTLQQTVFDSAFIQLVSRLFLFFQRLREQVFPPQGRGVLTLHFAGNLFHLGFKLVVNFRQLVIQLNQLGVRRTELRVEVGNLNPQVGLFRAQRIEQLGCTLSSRACVYKPPGTRGDRIRIAGLQQTVKGFLFHPLGFRQREGPVQLIQLGGGDVLFFVDSQNLVLFLVAHKFFLRRFHFHLQVDELLAEPIGNLHGVIEPGFVVVLLVVAHQLVHHILGGLRVRVPETN